MSKSQEETTTDQLKLLAQKAQRGDRRAFEMLCRLTYDNVFRYIHARVFDFQQAQDLTQETFECALRGIAKFRWIGSGFMGWLITIAHNRTASYVRKPSTKYEKLIEIADEHFIAPGYNDPEASVVRLSNRDLIQALRQLSQRERQCIVLRFMLDLSVEETARTMGIKPCAVRTLSYRAKHRLQAILPANFMTDTD